MSQQTSLTIADIALTLISDCSECVFQVEERFQGFVSDSSGLPDASLRVHCDVIPGFEFNSEVFDNGLGWRLGQSQGKWVLYIRSATHNPHHVGVFEPDFRAGDVYVRASQSAPGYAAFPLGRPLGELFMINLLSRGYGVLIHACGVKIGGKGLVFTGHGGAGKSTLSRLWQARPDVSVLGDDRLIVRQRDGRFWVYGTPWPGTGGVYSTDSAPLDHVFVIQHGSENKLTPLKPAEAVAYLLARSFTTFWDPTGMAFTLACLGELSQAVACDRLAFTPDPGVLGHVLCNI